MGEKTEIAWTDATFNPWHGCAKVSPGCDNCYAERDSGRFNPGKTLWGVNADRRTFGEKHWNDPIRWNRLMPAKLGRRPRVFCASMADVFDKNAPEGARDRLWELIKATPNLDWLILTKRIGNASRMLPDDWDIGYHNVWLGISVVNNEELERDTYKLLDIPAAIHFLSCEPLLGPLSLWEHLPRTPERKKGSDLDDFGLDWVIVGGESGPQSRAMQVEWVKDIADQCRAADVAFFMKQGSQANWHDFRNFDAFPTAVRIREWPTHYPNP